MKGDTMTSRSQEADVYEAQYRGYTYTVKAVIEQGGMSFRIPRIPTHFPSLQSAADWVIGDPADHIDADKFWTLRS